MKLTEALIILAVLVGTLFLGVHIGNKTRVVEAKASKSCWKVTEMFCDEKRENSCHGKVRECVNEK